MASTTFRSSNSRYVTAVVILGFLALEAAIGGRALVTLANQAVQAQSAFGQHITNVGN